MKTPKVSNPPKRSEPKFVKPGNVFEGTVVHVVEGPVNDLVTIRIASGIELTVTIVPTPFFGEPDGYHRPRPGDEITIGVPPPPAIPFAFGGKGPV